MLKFVECQREKVTLQSHYKGGRLDGVWGRASRMFDQWRCLLLCVSLAHTQSHTERRRKTDRNKRIKGWISRDWQRLSRIVLPPPLTYIKIYSAQLNSNYSGQVFSSVTGA